MCIVPSPKRVYVAGAVIRADDTKVNEINDTNEDVGDDDSAPIGNDATGTVSSIGFVNDVKDAASPYARVRGYDGNDDDTDTSIPVGILPRRSDEQRDTVRQGIDAKEAPAMAEARVGFEVWRRASWIRAEVPPVDVAKAVQASGAATEVGTGTGTRTAAVLLRDMFTRIRIIRVYIRSWEE